MSYVNIGVVFNCLKSSVLPKKVDVQGVNETERFDDV